MPFVNWRSNFNVSLRWSVWKRARQPESLAVRRHRLHTSLGWRGAISRCGAQLLAGTRLSHSACAGRLGGSGLGSRSYADRSRWCPRDAKKQALSRSARGGLAVALGDPRTTAKPWACLRSAMSLQTPARDAGQPVWRDLAAAARPGLGPAARDLRLRAAQGAARPPSASGRCRSRIALPSITFAGNCCESFCRWPSVVGLGLLELEGEIRTESRFDQDRDPTGRAHARRTASRAARRAATGATDLVRRRHRGSLVRATARAAGTSSGPLVRR